MLVINILIGTFNVIFTNESLIPISMNLFVILVSNYHVGIRYPTNYIFKKYTVKHSKFYRVLTENFCSI